MSQLNDWQKTHREVVYPAGAPVSAAAGDAVRMGAPHWTPITSPPERVPTGELVKRAREASRGWLHADLLTALADRLSELEALEPVARLLAAMAPYPGSVLRLTHGRGIGRDPAWEASAELMCRRVIPVLVDRYADTPEAALRALAEALGEGEG